MGFGTARRSKQTSKSSSTVLCDSAAFLEEWKQQIKVKDRIPANQQRLTFTSQRTNKQPVTLANFRWGRQWQIVVDASVNELGDQLQHWRATFYSKNTTAELLQPVVLNETDNRALTLHSRTAQELREVGVPCNVFFLSFNKWITSGILKEHTLSKRQPTDLDLKIDESFCRHTCLIDLYGELDGCCLSMPLSYVMNGGEVATKLLMLEQTAHYRDEQKQRYHQLATPTLKDSATESKENLAEVNHSSSSLKDYVLEFEKNCEFSAFVSKDHHRLRCIVLPVITIPLVELNGREEPSPLQLLSIDSRNGCTEAMSNLSSLPSTSQSEENLTSGSRSVCEGAICEASSPLPEARKSSKKKKKRKGKRSQKKDATKLDGSKEAGNTALPCEDGYVTDHVKTENNTCSAEGRVAGNDRQDDCAGCNWLTTSVSDGCCTDMDDRGIIKEGSTANDLVSYNLMMAQREGIAGHTIGGDKVPTRNVRDSGSGGLDLVDKLSARAAGASGRDSSASMTNSKPSKSKTQPGTVNNHSPNRVVVADYKKKSFHSLKERWEHAAIPRNGFSWSCRPQDFLPYRSRRSHDFSRSTGDSRSNAPFWRHQRNEQDWASHSWSKPAQSWQDDYPPADRGGRPAPREFQGWEQQVELRRWGFIRGNPNHWEIHNELEEPWPKEQTYSSFNMHRRKTCRSGRVPQQHPISWPADRHKERSGSMDVETYASDNHGSTTTDWDSQSKEEIAETSTTGVSQSYIDVQVASAPNLSSAGDNPPVLHDDKARNELGTPCLLGFQLPEHQVLEHVCGILEAVHASYVCGHFYEQVRSTNGHAMCEFEKVVKAVTPIFKAPLTLRHWNPMGCLCKNLAAGPFKSIHPWEAPDVPLSTLWQWYEEPSCYGLKVKLAESAKRLGDQLHAFFVPYLSAVQLFGWSSKEGSMQDEGEVVVCSCPFDSDFLSEPIFSILLPRERSDNNSLLMQQVAKSRQIGIDSESSGQMGMSRHCHCGVELVYEFFEGAKPQQRKPLTERIKELASSEAASELGAGCNAHMLTKANIGNLHPSSWFAIAWYPIYKIPDESFRAAFLTYHCFGSLQSVCSETLSGTSARMDKLTAPVVGLMSYNAQPKEWFALSPACHTEDNESRPNNVDPSEALQQYLAKLEKAAASMAQGSGDQSSGFKHSDFRFFQSRGN